MSETKDLLQQESCECKCGLNEKVCNSLQKSNHNECCCDCKELNDCGSCVDAYIWNRNTCDCDCNMTCKFDEYINLKNFSCEKFLLDKLVLT